MIKFLKKYKLTFAMLVLLSSCSKQSDMTLTPVSYDDLPRFENDAVEKALPALKKSCAIIIRQANKTYIGENGPESFKKWRAFCKCIQGIPDHASSTELKNALKEHLIPYRVTCDGQSQGVFTGYYEPLLKGSLKRHGKYQTPLYKKPSGTLATLKRSQIVAGALANKGLELVYVDDPIEAFFLQIQGSGRVQLEDGRILRLGYASGNKQPYTPIGKTLLDKGYFVKDRDKVTMQSIKKWLYKHPKQAEKIMSTNDSYVFFKVIKNSDGPIGAQGVALTPNRSIAIDPRYISLGTPLWLDIDDANLGKAQKLMVAQDTGGAIKGPIRGDYFWGFGHNAGEKAGIMNATGHYYLLLPR